MSILRVSLFGQLRVQYGEQILTDHFPPRLQELFAYLLLYRDRAHPREALADLLWSNSSTAQSKKNLRQALWQFQAAMDSQSVLTHCRVLLVDLDRIRINPDVNLRLDVADFEQAFARVQGTPGRSLDALQAEVLHGAVELYRGDLLEGWFQDWCLYERERLQNAYLATLDKLADYCESHGQYERGLAYGARILRCDGARERTHRRLMRLHYLAGDRTAALRQYDRCVEALYRELAVRPAARTVALYEEIRTERLLNSMHLSATDQVPPEASPEAFEMLRRLEQLQVAVSEVQRQLQHAIQAIELTISSNS